MHGVLTKVVTFALATHFGVWDYVFFFDRCASVQAIETESYKATKDLISYWILLSLISLFEYAFFRLLQW